MVVIVLPIRRPSETWTGNHYITQRSEEAVITAIVAAVLFVIALLLHLSGLSSHTATPLDRSSSPSMKPVFPRFTEKVA